MNNIQAYTMKNNGLVKIILFLVFAQLLNYRKTVVFSLSQRVKCTRMFTFNTKSN